VGQSAGAITMTKTESATQTTDAGRKFLELYAEPVVTNSYLKVAIMVLAFVSSTLLVLLYRAQTAAMHLKPLIISVTDMGRGQVMLYDDFRSIPIERVSKYYLARWTSLNYGRNHATVQRDFWESLNFFSGPLQNATLDRVRKARILDKFLLDPNQPNVDIEIKAVVLEDLSRAPYRARVEFEKIFRSPSDQAEIRRERWTASVVYTFRTDVPNTMLLTNPLGLVISYCHEDQAFGS
jgi:type IV secretory pathway TrbF-like protein